MDNKADGKLRLTPLQTFAIETRDLLRYLDGCVSLNRFAPNFQQLYGRPCKAADYGFNRISEVIDIICNVAEVRGKGVEKMVILVDGDNVAVPLSQGNRAFLLYLSVKVTALSFCSCLGPFPLLRFGKPSVPDFSKHDQR